MAEQVLPVAVADVKNHPRYKYFKESGEEEYHSFLGVPLIDRGILQGVLIVQTKDARVFREDEIRMLVDAAAKWRPWSAKHVRSTASSARRRSAYGRSRATSGGVGTRSPSASFAI